MLKKLLLSVVAASIILTAAGVESAPAAAETDQKNSMVDSIIKNGKLMLLIAQKLNQELANEGISSVEILKEVKKNPKKFRVQVPYHTRKRIIVLLPEHEKKLAESCIAYDKKQGLIYNDAKAERRIAAIAEKIVAVLPEKMPVNIYLYKSPQVNAFCLPDGTVMVTQGALKQLSNDMLAAVLAHEYGHAVSHHSAEKFTKMLMSKAVEVVVDAKMEDKLKNAPPGSKILIHKLYGLGSNVGFALPYSRVMEYEADRLSVIFLHKAGMDPYAAVKLMEFFTAESNKLEDWTEFLSTHPVSAKRLARLKEEVELLKKQQ